MLKKFVGGAAYVLAALAVAASVPADARSLDEIIKAGVIKVGVNPNLPPFSATDPKVGWAGFDIDVGNALAEKLGVKAEFVATETPSRVPNIVAGIIDISLGGLTRTSTRMKVIDYSFPLHTENMAVLTTEKHRDKKHYSDFNSSQYTMVGCRGCTPAKFTTKNVPQAKLVLVEGAAEIVRSVAQGRADAAIANLDFYSELMKAHPKVKWHILPEVIKTAYCAIGMKKGNHSLQSWINAALWEFHNAGTIVDIWEEHHGMKPIRAIVPQYFW